MTTPEPLTAPPTTHPPKCVPVCVPVCVPESRQGPGESSASPCPLSSGGDALNEPSASASPQRVPHTPTDHLDNHMAGAR